MTNVISYQKLYSDRKQDIGSENKTSEYKYQDIEQILYSGLSEPESEYKNYLSIEILK